MSDDRCDLCDAPADFGSLCLEHAYEAHLERKYEMAREATFSRLEKMILATSAVEAVVKDEGR